jgi:hypothetical protein
MVSSLYLLGNTLDALGKGRVGGRDVVRSEGIVAQSSREDSGALTPIVTGRIDRRSGSLNCGIISHSEVTV